VKAGDRLEVLTCGGGGWGDPLARDPAKVAADVAEALVSTHCARDDYGVILLDDGTVDAEATRNLRRERSVDSKHAHGLFDRGARYAALESAGEIQWTVPN
jgi:N-methylhydantoinase B